MNTALYPLLYLTLSPPKHVSSIEARSDGGLSTAALACGIFIASLMTTSLCTKPWRNLKTLALLEMWSPCFFRFFSCSSLQISQSVSNIGKAPGYLNHSSLEMHGIVGTTHSSSFARTSGITLSSSVSSDQTSKIPLFRRASCNLVFSPSQAAVTLLFFCDLLSHSSGQIVD